VETAAVLVSQLALTFPGRMVHVVADAAYHGPALCTLPANVAWTCRIPRNAALYDLARPTRPPRTKSQRLGTAGDILCRCRHRMETVMYPIHYQIGKARLARIDARQLRAHPFREVSQIVGRHLMLARERAQIEEPRLDRVEPRRIDG